MSIEAEKDSSRSLSGVERTPALPGALVGAAFAGIGALPLPYGYYPVLRVVLCITAVVIAVMALRVGKPGWLGLAIPTVVLWAPAATIHLPRDVWQVLDVAVAIALVIAGVKIPGPTARDEQGNAIAYLSWWKITGAIYAALLVAGLLLTLSSGHGCADVSYDHSGASCSDFE